MENKLQFIRLFLILIAVLSANVAASQSATDQVRFSNGWVKMPMPGMHMTAAFVDIENLINSDLRLIAVKTSFSAMSELHEMVMINNVMQMRHASDGWIIAPGATLNLAPGGKHAMLMGLKSLLQNHSATSLEFNIEGMGWISVPAVVKTSLP